MFTILTPQPGITLFRQANDLMHQLSELLGHDGAALSQIVQARFFLTDSVNQWPALHEHPLVELLEQTGVVSYVEQPPLGGSKVALLLWFIDERMLGREVGESASGKWAAIKGETYTYVMHTVRFSPSQAAGTGSKTQMLKAFAEHKAVLTHLGGTIEADCQRTWIYVRDIDAHYTGAVEGRNEFFAQEGLYAHTHFIASTGIGGISATKEALVAADFFSVLGLERDKIRYLHATDYLNPTHEYGVAFERGTALDLPDGQLYLISGTASIDKHGKCLHLGDVVTQAGRLFLNIEKLLEDGGSNLEEVKYMIVYLRDVADYDTINRYLQIRFPHVPRLITEARVCRPEWLVEVECVAQKPAT